MERKAGQDELIIDAGVRRCWRQVGRARPGIPKPYALWSTMQQDIFVALGRALPIRSFVSTIKVEIYGI